MKWLWLILILLISGVLWWLCNRNRSTDSSGSTGDSRGFSAGGTASSGTSAPPEKSETPAEAPQRDLHSAAPPADPAPQRDLHSASPPADSNAGASPNRDLHSASPPADSNAGASPNRDLHSASSPADSPADEPVAFVSEPAAPAEPAADELGTTDLHSTSAAPGKFGEGSADPAPDGSGPAGWTIKANQDSMKFHTEESPWYERTAAEIWFESEERAAAAGFKRWDDRS